MTICPTCGESHLNSASFADLCERCFASLTARGETPASSSAPQLASGPAAAIPADMQAQHLGPRWSLTTVLVAANALVFLAMVLKGVHWRNPSSEALIQWGANYGPLTLGGQWWRLFSMMFLHIGIIHLAFNLWALWNLGSLGETLYPRRVMLLIYLLSGLAGSLASVWWRPVGVSAGASGAIFGLAGALLASLYLGKLPFDPRALKATISSLLSFAVYSLLFGFFVPGIDNAAHLGGLAAGLMMGGAIGTLIFAQRRQRPLVLRGVFAAALLLLLLGGYYIEARNGYVVHVHRANLALQQNKFDAAIGEWKRVVALRPNEAQAWFGLGSAIIRQRANSPDAESAFARALQLNPEFTPAQVERGKVLLLQNRFDEAIKAFEQARQQQPRNLDAVVNLGIAQAQLGRHAEAIAAFEEALKIAPQLPFVRVLLAQQLAASRNFGRAIEVTQEALNQTPNDLGLLSLLQQLYVANKMPKEAGEVQGRISELQRHAQEQGQKQPPAPAQ